MMKMNSQKSGIVLSYIAIGSTMLTNIILLPFFLRYVGENEYGLYQYVYSLAQYAMIMDFGISTIMIKYIAHYKAKQDRVGLNNFAAHALLITASAAIIILIIGGVLYTNLNSVIVNRSASEMSVARVLFILMIVRILIALLRHYFEGALLGYKEYFWAKGFAVLRVILNFAFVIALVFSGKGVLGIVIADVASSALCLLCSAIMVFVKTDLRIKWDHLDTILLKDASILAFALMLQSIVTYANSALDKYIAGTFLDNIAVTTYTIALLVSEAFTNLTTTVNSVFMPSVAGLVEQGRGIRALEDYVIKVGRLQCTLCMGIICGFALFGMQFITLWSGKANSDAWLVAMILLLFSALPLMQSTCLSILAIMNKRLFRSVMLLGMAVLHVIISVVLVKQIGIIGVAIGSAIALLLGNNLIMNIYYKRVIGLDVIRMIRGIFSGIGLAAILASVLCIPFLFQENKGILSFVIGIFAFCTLYGCALFLFGLNKSEKTTIRNMYRKVVLKKNA